jgi:hypothetical protein
MQVTCISGEEVCSVRVCANKRTPKFLAVSELQRGQERVPFSAANNLGEVVVASSIWEDPSGAQLRKIISGYLDEVLRYYKEQQRIGLGGPGSEPDQRLEQKAAELLGAMMTSGDPVERRRAVLQVLSQAKQHRETILPS